MKNIEKLFQNMTWKKALIIIIVVMVIVYLVKKWSREVTDPGLPDASLQAGGGVIPEDWSPKPITDNFIFRHHLANSSNFIC